MKTLYIYPTSRAIRRERELLRGSNRLLPTFMRIDEFEQRVILLPQLTMVDTLQRVVILQKASQFDTFENLKINRELIRFFTKSDSILKFFEELSHEEVDFDDLIGGDSFVEFSEHIEILEELLKNYKTLLNEKGLTDRAFIPKIYQLNSGFIDSYDSYELFLEGYMSRFELSLIEQIAKTKPFIIHFQTSKFNKKVIERFLEMGVEEFALNSFISFDLQSKKIIRTEPNTLSINAKVFSVEERLSQIPILFESVQKMVNSGIPPQEIAVILPDENIKDAIKLYDSFNNFNFAMGFDYDKSRNYKQLEAIYSYWQSFSTESIILLKKYNIDLDRLNELKSNTIMGVDEFFGALSNIVDLDLKKEIVQNSYIYFRSIFKKEQMSLKSFLFLWLKILGKLSIDDVQGGKVTVIGALETRGVSFSGVVILDFNDGIVPAIPAKDNFLNSSIRKHANLPTKNDREALQKQLYKRVLEQAKEATIIYSQSSNRTPASYLYELNLGLGKEIEPNLDFLYNQPSQIVNKSDPIIKNFDATAIIWSATRLKTFLSCRREYYYLYEKDLRAKSSNELNEGAFLHKLLEQLFKDRDSFKSFEEMKNGINILLDRLLESQTAKIAYNKLLWKTKLSTFIKSQIRHFKSGWRVVDRERHIKGEIAGLRFKGIVDRIDQKLTQTLIIDYKSGSVAGANRIKNIEKLTDFQMSIYSEILKPKYKNIELVFMELFNGKITPITELNTKTKFLYKIIDELKEIKEVKAYRCEDISRCQYCDYTLLCERGDYL
jgi:hypothetical protein